MSKAVNLILSFLFLACFMAACYEPVQGCLDVLATNYSITADESCPDEIVDCCTYPAIFLDVEPMVGDQGFSEDSIYVTLTNDSFRIVQAMFFIGDFNARNLDGEIVEIDEDLSFTTLSNGQSIISSDKDDVALVIRPRVNFEFGEFKSPDVYEAFGFSFGLNPNWNHADISSLSELHILNTSDSLQISQEEGFVFARFDVIPNYNIPDTTSYIISGDVSLKSVQFDTTFTVDRGVDVYLPVFVDYGKWFEGVDFISDDKNQIELKLSNNTINSFSIN